MMGPGFAHNLKDVPISTLAYIGDAVYEWYARLFTLNNCCSKAGDLHRRSVELVKAKAQAEAIRHLLPALTEDEMSIFRRGRNSQPLSRSKHADPADYLMATGLEAVIGYLSLKRDDQRLDQLMSLILERTACENESGQKTI